MNEEIQGVLGRIVSATKDESFMRNFRWITPLAVSICTLMVTISTVLLGYLVYEIRSTREFAMTYTNQMVGTTRHDVKALSVEVGALRIQVENVEKNIASIRTYLTKKLD